MLRELHDVTVFLSWEGTQGPAVLKGGPDHAFMTSQRPLAWSDERFADFTSRPLRLTHSSLAGRNVWVYGGRVYTTTETLTPGDVLALLSEKENRAKSRLARAYAAMEQANLLGGVGRPIADQGRRPIADDVKVFVWQRDQGKCVRCGSNQNLEFDHIIPITMGGANTARNLQLLCEGCNRSKGGSLA
jgi:hypothetical protein